MRLFFRVINGLLFYVNWTLCIYGAVHQMPWLGVLSAFCIIIFHFSVITSRYEELLLIGGMTVAGAIIDSCLMFFGVYEFIEPNSLFPHFIPIWVLSLHAIFGTTINHSLSYLNGHWLFAAVLGAGGGIISYFAGEKVGAVIFLIPEFWALAIIGAIWFVYTPSIIWFWNKICLR